MCKNEAMSAFKAIRYYKFDVTARTFGGGYVAKDYVLVLALVKYVLDLASEAKLALETVVALLLTAELLNAKNMGVLKLEKSFKFSKR